MEQLNLFWRPEQPKPEHRAKKPADSPSAKEELYAMATPCIKCGVKPVFYVSTGHHSIQGYVYDYVGMKCPLCGWHCGGAGGEDMESVKHWNSCNTERFRRDL